MIDSKLKFYYKISQKSGQVKMLREICFQLQKETSDILQEKMESLLTDLAVHGVKVSGLQTEGEDGVNPGEETMYITDSGNVYNALRREGHYVLPCFHEDNRGESFSGAVYAVEKLEETDFASLDMAYRRLAGLPWEILETERLFVRETTTEDVDSFYRIYAEPAITEYMENLFADRDEEIAYTQSYIETVYAFYGYGLWTVLEKDSGAVVGRAGISWREGYNLPELGFVIGVPWQGQGYAFEVCSAILDYAKEELEMTRVQALVRPGNGKSLKLCGKLGFAYCEETELDGEKHLVFVKEL